MSNSATSLQPLSPSGPPSGLQRLVAEDAPQLFAIGAEYDDGESDIVAWGVAFEERSEVVSVEGDYRLSTTAPERALLHFQEGGDTRMHLLWVAQCNTAVQRGTTSAQP